MKQELTGVTSVLIPLYNHEKFIGQCLDSLLMSDCSKIELIIADDCSQDDSVAITKNWLGEHKNLFVNTQLLVNEVNLGPTKNLNKLATLASGEFITLLASDDFLSEKAIDRQRDYLEHHLYEDFVFSNCAIANLNGSLIKPQVVSPPLAFCFKCRPVIMFNVLFNWSIVWARLFGRRSSFMAFGGYIEEHTHEDRWSALKILNSRRFGYLDNVVHIYRYRGFEAHPAVSSSEARKDFHDAERRIHKEAKGLLNCLLWVRRLPFKTNWGRWPARVTE